MEPAPPGPVMLILDTVLYRPRGCPGYTSIHTSREPAFWLGVNDLFCVVIFKCVWLLCEAWCGVVGAPGGAALHRLTQHNAFPAHRGPPPRTMLLPQMVA